MRRNGNIWEYIAAYVDDLTIIMKDPKSFTDLLIDKYKYKLKGVGPITNHLGSDYKRDPDMTFYVSTKSYIDKMIESYERTFGANRIQLQRLQTTTQRWTTWSCLGLLRSLFSNCISVPFNGASPLDDSILQLRSWPCPATEPHLVEVIWNGLSGGLVTSASRRQVPFAFVRACPTTQV